MVPMVESPLEVPSTHRSTLSLPMISSVSSISSVQETAKDMLNIPEPSVKLPLELTVDLWNSVSNDDSIELTCMMPNGIMILLKAHCSATVAEIKEELWEEITKYPLYGKLHDMSDYVLSYVNTVAEIEVLPDESQKICDIRPICGVFIVSEIKGNSIDNTINIAIGHLIGKRLQEFDALNNTEINDFRFKMKKVGDEISQQRTKNTWLEKLYYQFPPRISENNLALLESGEMMKIEAKCELNDHEFIQNSSIFYVSPNSKPKELLKMVFSRKASILRNERMNDYVLKVCGMDEYLVGNYELIKFQYIQDCISRENTPSVLVIHVDRVPVIHSNDYESIDLADSKKMRTTSANFSNTLRKKKHTILSWSIDKPFSITLCTVAKLNTDINRVTNIGLQVGLFHGGKPLCQPIKTTDKTVFGNNDIEYNDILIFDINVCNIPRSAKLCFVVYEIKEKNPKGTKVKKTKDSSDNFLNPIAWANTSIYDFKGQLKTGAMTLYMWTYAEDMMSEEVLHPLGTTVSNPNTDYSTALTLKFEGYSENQTIIFPAKEYIIEYTKSKESELEADSSTRVDSQYCKKLLQENDNFYDSHDQDRKNIWSLKRYWMLTAPEVLPKLLTCIDWHQREDVCQVLALLQEWPKLPVEKSLELLDYAYADQEVRSFAVMCLKDVSNDDLLLYLLQLVQAIKHELYLECDLVHFLINRALHNQLIGHFLFWHLRSEMSVPSVSVRFGLILEAYCRASQEHMNVLQKQLECIEKLKKCSDLVRQRKDKEKAKASLREYLSEVKSVEAVNHIRSPLNPSYRCTRIKTDKCRFMDSKMRPLWVVFENSDIYGEDVYIIFKNGDDLRQDMLTLQMLKIMDRLWKRERLDLRMNPYACISLENRVGMIEVVLEAETIANIQKEKGMFSATASFRKGPILAWLKDHNPTEAALNKAVNEFTLSCAGYCVATYVLGIADRHSDNIMVKKSGQMFHIDFGHILGHFKEKFGFKRERVPFVLTHDFVYVINKGQKAALEFKIFQEYCEKAFLILRKHGNLILSLFAMMISTGLPELSSEKDLNYLKETLVLSKTEEEALTHFQMKFDEALSNSWKTSLNWASHNISKNNKA